jgi:magnesium chelatase family protein
MTRYRQRLTPLLDAADIRISLPASTPPAGGPVAGEASHTVAARVARARAIAAARWSRYGLTLNRELGTGALGTDPAGAWAAQVTTLQVRPDAGHLSFLQASRALAVAWTLADLAGRDRPGEPELADAIALHGNPVPGDTTGEVR